MLDFLDMIFLLAADKKLEAETPAPPVASPGGASSPRAKRVRTIFSAEQLERLEAEFARQQYMVGPERLILAASLRLSESQVRYQLVNHQSASTSPSSSPSTHLPSEPPPHPLENT